MLKKQQISFHPFLRLAFALLVAVLPLLAPAASTSTASAQEKARAKVHDALQQRVERDPSGWVDVIVQQDDKRGKSDLEPEVKKASGLVTRRLPLINGFAARLPAGAVQALAAKPGVYYLSLDAPVRTLGLSNTYDNAVGAPAVWNNPGYKGRGVSVAVIDSGVNPSLDLRGRLVASVNMMNPAQPATDGNGHGTHVAGIIAGDGTLSGGRYIGIAPEANIVNVKVTDELGMAYASTVIDGLQWVVANKSTHNIRVANLSLTSTVAESYLTSPLNAAVEAAWFQGVVVVTAAGNSGANTMLYAPGNDPFAITVGATDTVETNNTWDDLIPLWSSYGLTQDGFSKPDVVAPGRRIVSLNGGSNTWISTNFPDRIVESNYLLLSGTSMAAAVVSGIAALTFQAHPTWTPNQFKWVLKYKAQPFAFPGAGSGYANAQFVVAYDSAPGEANLGITPNVHIDPATGLIAGTTATWSSATWSSATWTSSTLLD